MDAIAIRLLDDAPWWAVTATVGLILLLTAALIWWALRAAGRLAVATGAAVRRSAETSPEHRGRAGAWMRRWSMTLLFAAVVAIVVGLSAQTLVGWLMSVGMHPWWARLAFVAFDGMAVMLALTLWRRAERGESIGMIRAGVWALVAATAWFNSHHAPPGQTAAAIAYAAFPVVAAIGLEVLLQESRRDRSWLRRQAGDEANRRLALVRWLHPVERARVALMLASDERMGAEAATREVRVHAAATAVFRLRRMDGWAARMVAAERRAQRALARAGVGQDTEAMADVLRRVQILDQAGRIAALDYSTPAAARMVVGSLITPASLTEPVCEPTSGEPVAAREPHPPNRKSRMANHRTGGGDNVVTPMPARLTDEELENRARQVYRPGMTVADFRAELGVGMRRAHPLLVRLRERSETG